MRMVLRLKVLHLGVGLGVVFPASVVLLGSQGSASATELGLLASLAGGAIMAGASMSWYCERIAQQISWRAAEQVLEVSTLTMYGARRDRHFKLDQVEPTYAPGGPDEGEIGKVLSSTTPHHEPSQ